MTSSSHGSYGKIVISGGLGFLGSNLAHALAKSCRSLHIIDNHEPGLGANRFNVAGIDSRVHLHNIDLRSSDDLLRDIFVDTDLFLHCAGNGDHGASMRDPLRDLELNAGVLLRVMQALRVVAPSCRLITVGSRAEYGPTDRLPVAEDERTRPLGCYAISKLAATQYALAYARHYAMDIVVLRSTNIFGERAQMAHPGYGVANWFLRQALCGEPITIFGDGKISRDYVYVRDFVSAVLKIAHCRDARGRVINIGGTPRTSLLALADAAIAASGSGTIQFRPYPETKRALEPGDFQADVSLLERLVAWRPSTPLDVGMRATADYYRTCLGSYGCAPREIT